ncbi:hypothetical protein Tco_0124892, partial [Tanacetum coccineum]
SPSKNHRCGGIESSCSRNSSISSIRKSLPPKGVGTGYSLKGKNKAKPDKTEHGFGKSEKN